MCVCACAIDKECHRICVCPRQRYRVAGLLEREMDMCSLSLWHGYLPAALDYRCVVGEEGGPINYRGTMAGICVEEERGLPHVLRRSICLMY